MKLATYNNQTRDGQLMVVSRDHQYAVSVTAIAPTLQAALDDWSRVAPLLHEVSERLNQGVIDDVVAFDETQCLSPLPRAYQWADGSAYVNHVELVRRARNAAMPESFWTNPLIYQGGSDAFIAPHAPIPAASEKWGIDFESEVAVVTSDVPMGCPVDDAGQYIALVMLVNDVSLRGLIPEELAKGFGFYNAKPASAFSPIAVTPDELGKHWHGHKVHLPLVTHYNNNLFGKPNAGQDMTFDFAQLIAHAAKTRSLTSGTIIGSGTVSNKQGTGPGSAIAEGGVGYSCIAEVRMIETIRYGQPETAFMRFGDTVTIEMFDEQGKSIFGRINQQVIPYSYQSS